jgi:peptidoglycan/LPS O-acetylase OafA/YrhL
MSEATANELRKASRPTIDTLIGIRGLGSIWVMIEHFRFVLYSLFPATTQFDWWFTGANLGMEMFFPLSGFVIAYMYADRIGASAGSYRDFLVKRFARIYPVFLLTFLVVAALVGAASIAHVTLNYGSRFTPLSFIGNIFMLQCLPGIPAWNVPAWSVSAEVLAYVAFPLTAWLLMRLTTPKSAVIAALAWLVVGTSAMMGMRLVDTSWTSPGMALLRITTEFVAGAMLWKAWSLAGEPQSLRWDGLAVVLVSLVLLGQWLLPQDESFIIVLAPLMAFFVFALAGASGPVRWLLSTRVMLFGGNISYSLYMVHFIVFIVVGKLLRWEPYENSPLEVRLALMAFYYLTCIVIAIACYYAVEEPARRAIQRAATRRKAKRSPDSPFSHTERQPKESAQSVDDIGRVV